MREIVLINITGEDRPGLTAAITGVLAQGGVNILDIGQAVIHDTLSFGILIEIPDNERASSVLRTCSSWVTSTTSRCASRRFPRLTTSTGSRGKARPGTSSRC